MTDGFFQNRKSNLSFITELFFSFKQLLTDDSSDIIPHRQAVGLGFLPLVVVAQVEGKPEEEGVVDQLQTCISQGILQGKRDKVITL